MNDAGFRTSAIIACKKYYRHLSDHNCGASISYVVDFRRLPNSRTDFLCQLNQKLVQLDSCEVYVNELPTKHVSILKYYREAKRYYVLLRAAKNPEEFSALHPSDITIRSDLRFLIKRLGEFYSRTSLNFSPLPPEPLPEHAYPVKVTPSAEQLSAISGILTEPVSYVWGPPGSGKTNVVLSECVLRYINAAKRIFLLAPTNNAVDQMLRGVLPSLRSAGIDLHCVYRLGISTAAFAKEYPEVVGSSELESERAFLLSQKAALETELASAREYEQTVQKNRAQLSFLLGLKAKLEECCELEGRIAPLRDDLRSFDSALEDLSRQKKRLISQCEQASHEISRCRSLISCCRYSLRWNRLLFWRKGRIDELKHTIEKLSEKQSTLKQFLADSPSSMRGLANEESRFEALRKAVNSKLSPLTRQQGGIISYVLGHPDTPKEVKLLFSTLDEVDLSGASAGLEQYIDEQTGIFMEYESRPPRSVEEITTSLRETEASIGQSSEHGKLRQLDDALVLAGTIHSSLRYFSTQQSKPISHVFLDEAGYTSAAYGLVPFSCGCPVTFLGDHCQLPPICEMSPVPSFDKEVCLFALPCAYFSEVTACSIDSVYDLYRKVYVDSPVADIPPSFFSLPMFSLSKSYRFADKLAAVLSEYLYPSRFIGISGSVFDIIILDAPNPFPKSQNRTSPYEVNAIRKYLHDHSSELGGSVAVLSPYRNQQQLIFRALSSLDYDVLTVHRAQGTEYDTVILSVVDKSDAFFTVSNLPVGRRVLNTALSRTKKRLVIVCDVAFWKSQNHQLITELISLGTLVSPSVPSQTELPQLPDYPAHNALIP